VRVCWLRRTLLRVTAFHHHQRLTFTATFAAHDMPPALPGKALPVDTVASLAGYRRLAWWTVARVRVAAWHSSRWFRRTLAAATAYRLPPLLCL